jgi:two-component system nitrogen regulation sensor histidine kinase NtrY
MDYKKFSIKVITRVGFITVTALFAGYLFFEKSFYFTASFFLALTILQSVWLAALVNKSNRQLIIFLDAIQYAEFNKSFKPTGLGTVFDGLSSSFNKVLSEFHTIRKEKEEQFFFYQNVVQHIGISMMAYDMAGEIIMLNNAATKLFRLTNPQNIKSLEKFSPEIVPMLRHIENNQRKLFKVHIEDDYLQLAIYAKKFKQEDKEITIVSVQNIESELEQNEMEAWQKLIRVLTHEIMNSITPISSLSSTVNQMIEEWHPEKPEQNDEIGSDIKQALKTIQKRSDGLLQFVQTYRNLTKTPKPNFQIIEVVALFKHLQQLFQKNFDKAGISCQSEITPEQLEITADESMIEQVLINLIRNAIHATSKTKAPRIIIKAAYGNYGNVLLQVTDNGQGILPEVLEKVFIPFFTTKPSGSGIGLSLSRQLIRAQGGNLTVNSEPGKTTFTIRL